MSILTFEEAQKILNATVTTLHALMEDAIAEKARADELVALHASTRDEIRQAADQRDAVNAEIKGLQEELAILHARIQSLRDNLAELLR